MVEEIARLTEVRRLLSTENGYRPDRLVKKNRHAMSADGRARISAAQKKRWAKQKKAAK
jgi:hypothetical protein